MSIATAKKRFIVGNPVVAGVNYKHTINGKQYIFQAKYNKTLSEFNSMWFENLTPKEYFMSSLALDITEIELAPNDTIIVDGVKYVNEQSGTLSKEELAVIFSTYKEARLVSGLLLTGNEDHRIHKINIRPFRNENAEELKYFSLFNLVRTPTVRVFKVNKPQQVVFEVIETFSPLLPGGVASHSAIVNFTGFSVSYEGTSPTSTTATTATYTIPNELTSRKLTVIPNGDTGLTLKFE